MACRATDNPGHRLVLWRIQNLDEQPLEILAAWLPHNKFHSNRCRFEQGLRLTNKESGGLELLVACREPPSSRVENAFVILQFVWRGQRWRAFARHLVALDSGGVPQPLCQEVTIHPIGFASPDAREAPQGR